MEPGCLMPPAGRSMCDSLPIKQRVSDLFSVAAHDQEVILLQGQPRQTFFVVSLRENALEPGSVFVPTAPAMTGNVLSMFPELIASATVRSNMRGKNLFSIQNQSFS